MDCFDDMAEHGLWIQFAFHRSTNRQPAWQSLERNVRCTAECVRINDQPRLQLSYRDERHATQRGNS